MHAASKWIQNESVSKLQSQVHTLTVQLLNDLQQIAGVNILRPCIEPENCGIVSFNIGSMDCREVAMILDQSFDIQSRAGLHCAPLLHDLVQTAEWHGCVRLSPGVFTTPDDVSIVVDAIRQIAAHCTLA